MSFLEEIENRFLIPVDFFSEILIGYNQLLIGKSRKLVLKFYYYLDIKHLIGFK
ncbi:MAG: hypothetical protein ACFFAN_10750 [Promethearchaeota archaeon]